MYRRSLPPFPDLSAFLAYLDGKGALRTIAAPIDVNLEITEVHRRVIAAGGPVLRFEQPIAGGRAAGMPAIANLFGTRERVAAGLGTIPSNLERLGAFMAWMRSPQPPRSIAEAGRLFPAARAALQSCALHPCRLDRQERRSDRGMGAGCGGTLGKVSD